MIAPTLSFFTPVIRNGSLIMNYFERSIWFGGEVCQIVLEGSDTSLGVLKNEESDYLTTALKIVNIIMTAGLFVVIALIIRFVSRNLGDRIVLFPDSLSQPYQSPNLIQPTPRIEGIRRELSDEDIPFRQAIFLRAQTFGQPDTSYIIKPELIIASRLRAESVVNKITEKERVYLSAYVDEAATAVCREFPEIAPVLGQLKMLQGSTLLPPVQPINRIHTVYGAAPVIAPSLIPLHKRSGGHVLGVN